MENPVYERARLMASVPDSSRSAKKGEAMSELTERLASLRSTAGFYAAVAIRQRVSDDARRETKAHRLMAQSFLEAWKAWRA